MIEIKVYKPKEKKNRRRRTKLKKQNKVENKRTISYKQKEKMRKDEKDHNLRRRSVVIPSRLPLTGANFLTSCRSFSITIFATTPPFVVRLPLAQSYITLLLYFISSLAILHIFRFIGLQNEIRTQTQINENK